MCLGLQCSDSLVQPFEVCLNVAPVQRWLLVSTRDACAALLSEFADGTLADGQSLAVGESCI